MKTNLKRIGGLLLGLVTIASLASCGKKSEGNTHTYLGSFSLSPDIFDPLQYKSTTDSVPIDYTTNSFYEFAYNDAGNGFELKHVMAAADPQDVTSEYAEELVNNAIITQAQKATAKDYAFRIALNPDAKWENGDPITADSYIYTMKTLFRSDLNCYRASNYYQGGAAILNAKEYFYSGKQVVLSDEGLYDIESVDDLYFSLKGDSLFFAGDDWLGGKYGNSFWEFYDGYFCDTYREQAAAMWESGDLTGEGAYACFAGKTQADFADYAAYEQAVIDFKFKGDGATPLRAAIQAVLDAYEAATKIGSGAAKGLVQFADVATQLGAVAAAFVGSANYAFAMASYVKTFDTIPWEDVGLKKVNDYTIDIVYKGTISGFYQKYTIGLPLVHEATYESCISTDPATGAVTSSYGTTTGKYMSYGPYKFTKYVNDQIMEFERNTKWFGYTEKYADEYGTFVAEFDGQVHKQYETDKIVLKYVKDISTREQMFLAGELDALGCNAALYKKYKTSERLYNATGAATYYGILCSDYDSLVEREAVLNKTTYSASYDGSKQQYNKTILTIKEFRQAFCYCLDRSALIAALYPAGSAATSLFSNLIIADPENGTPFNSFESTMKAVCEFWGVDVTQYPSIEAAYNAISGYNLEKAQELLEVAVTKAKDAKLLGNNTVVKLDYCASADSETEQLWYQTFKACLTNLVKGTSLEGKFEYDYNTNLGSDFGGAIQSGKADTAWGFGWSGGELDPYDLVQVFVDAASGTEEPYQYDMWMNRDGKEYEITLTLDIGDGSGAKEYTYTAYDWYQILNGVDANKEGLPNWKYQNVPDAIRAEVLAAVEKRILQDYTNIPLFNAGSLQLLSYKVNYGKEKYIFGMGFGGIRYMTYNYTDAEWAKFVASQPNKTINY